MSFSRADVLGIDRAATAARVSGQTQWVARVVEAVQIDVLNAYARIGTPDRFLWERRDANESFVAWGRVDEIESAGSERFEDVAAWASGLVSRLHWIGIERPRTAPIFFGGFGFEDDGTSAAKWKAFPAARFVLPAGIGESLDGRTRITLLARVEPGTEVEEVEAELSRGRVDFERVVRGSAHEPASDDGAKGDDPGLDEWAVGEWPAGPEYRVRSDRPHSIFSRQVDAALEAIEKGELDKVVLARSLRVENEGRLDIPEFLGRLRGLYPSCTLVAMGRGDDTFLAATPETLIRVQGDRVETAALAGSAPRGRTPGEDLDYGRELKGSAKERSEHAHVVAALRRVLAPRCVELDVPEAPELRKLFGIQHLETVISARLRTEHGGESGKSEVNRLLQLVGLLHPTPAVGGVPRAPARDWLRRTEGLDRGWYASPVGWIDSQGGGDFCVALRSALIHVEPEAAGGERASRAWLFAGAGIVAGSEPEAELAETRIKLRALLAPLTEI